MSLVPWKKPATDLVAVESQEWFMVVDYKFESNNYFSVRLNSGFAGNRADLKVDEKLFRTLNVGDKVQVTVNLLGERPMDTVIEV